MLVEKFKDLTLLLQASVGAAPLLAMITSCSGLPLQVVPPGFTLHSFAEPERVIAREKFGSFGYATG